MKNELFTLVSCSDLIPLKRVHLIVEILAKIPFKIRWIHFGDGPEMSNIKSRSETQLKQHETKFMGNVSNAAILDFIRNPVSTYLSQPVQLKGCPSHFKKPVALRIPCLATDVGGISEVINNESGILIPSDFDVNTVAKQIIEFKTSTKNSLQNRKRIRVEWQDKFKAENTYNEFIDHLKSL
ncbi:MAG: glycosyltransferase [Crocinitomicaceae bacterium]|nr:glycosyltransferase [Crocinitomicaceae bacterium]